jgi:hypothetical protein
MIEPSVRRPEPAAHDVGLDAGPALGRTHRGIGQHVVVILQAAGRPLVPRRREQVDDVECKLRTPLADQPRLRAAQARNLERHETEVAQVGVGGDGRFRGHGCNDVHRSASRAGKALTFLDVT